MKTRLTKFFHFSASYSDQGKVLGHNYTLGATTDWLEPDAEILFQNKITENLIQKIDSCDLGLHVDFLKGIPATDLNLLKNFWTRVEKAADPAKLYSLSLERDNRTKATLSYENV